MEWFFGFIGLLAAGAAILAVWEWKTNRKITYDTPEQDAQSARGAYTQAEQIRTQDAVMQQHHSDGPPPS